MGASRLYPAMFVTLLLAGLVSSSYIADSVSIRDSLDSGLDLTEEISISIINNTDNMFSLAFSKDSVLIKVNDVPLDAANRTAAVPLRAGGNYIRASFVLPGAAREEKKGHFTFSRTLNLPTTPETLNYTIVLPGGTSVEPDRGESDPAIVPKPSNISTDGRLIAITWIERSPQLPRRYYIRYAGAEASDTPAQQIKDELSESFVWAIIIATLMIGIPIGLLLCKVLSKRAPVQVREYIPSTLFNPDEKMIIKEVRLGGGKITQKDIGRKLGWSKSKVSGIMTNLEYKKVVKREKIGRNYRVELIKDIKE